MKKSRGDLPLHPSYYILILTELMLYTNIHIYIYIYILYIHIYIIYVIYNIYNIYTVIYNITVYILYIIYITFTLSEGHFCEQCFISMYSALIINFQNIYISMYQKTLLQTLLLLVFKIVESLQCILKKNRV